MSNHPKTQASADDLLKVEDLKVHFQLPRKKMLTPGGTVHAVDGISFNVRRGSTFGIVGESGSGKTTAALAAMRLVPITSGSIKLDDTELTDLDDEEMRLIRRKIQIVFQDPYRSLNPRRTIEQSLIEGPMNFGMRKTEALAKAREVLEIVGISPDAMGRFPHQFSGGQRQRIGIARAMYKKSDIIIFDEATSSLDNNTENKLLNEIEHLKDKYTIVTITHKSNVAKRSSKIYEIRENRLSKIS